MLKFFRKKKEVLHRDLVQDKVATKIVTNVTAFQTKWAIYMQKASNRLSCRSKKVATIAIVLFASVYSLYIIAASLIEKPKATYTISKIHVSSHATQTGDEKLFTKNIIPENEYNKIVRFHHYMDSLNQTISGKRIADSIIQRRPGLLDSSLELRRLYELQQNIKK
ncbi:hypothetical protein [Ferruginibacter sp.]